MKFLTSSYFVALSVFFLLILECMSERQITRAEHGHILTNIGCWSHDGAWIVYDVRPDLEGSVFEGNRIERVHVETGEVEVLYQSAHGAHCGVVTASPLDDRVVFIHGPENPTPDWHYAANHRRCAMVRASIPGQAKTLDARDLVPPFTSGALRGGTHVHVFSGDAQWVSFTYQDHVLASLDPALDLRNVGVSVPNRSVKVPKTHSRNHDGTHFSVLVTQTTPQPKPGSDEIKRAYGDAWVGQRALAFLGDVVTGAGETITELYIVDLPEDLTMEGSGGLSGTETTSPQPPKGIVQRRLTRTDARAFPGVQGVRHWPRSAPDGSRIAFFMKDDHGIAQLWTIHPNGDGLNVLTKGHRAFTSAFSWSHDGNRIACVVDGSVSVVNAADGAIMALTTRRDSAPRPEACVFSPDGKQIAYVCEVDGFNQIFVCDARG